MAQENPRLREALEELQGYLADNLAPLLVADAIETLLDYPPGVTAEQLRAWSAFQYQGRRGETPFADLLYHAAKKVQQLEELNLVEAERFDQFLAGLVAALVEACPPEERERFLGLLRHLRETVGGATGLVGSLHHVAAAAVRVPRAAPPTPTLSPEEIRDLRRFSLLLQRSTGQGSGGAAGAAPEATAQQLLVLAAAGARSAPELESRLESLRAVGMAPPGIELIKALIGAVPDWAVAAPGGVKTPTTGSLEAVRRAVKHAGNNQASADRWKELLRSAAEQFNRGAFGRAVTLVDLAERMVKEGEIEARYAEIVRGVAHEAYDLTALLQATGDPRHRPILRRLLEFHPGWAPRELLDQLDGQPEPKRRRLLLALLEIWGVEARESVLDRLEVSLGDSRNPNAWWFQRNLVFLLRRLPRPAEGGDARRELELVGPLSSVTNHPSFQREAIQLLGELPGQLGVPTLIQRLGEVERALEANPPPQPAPELWKVLTALAAGLARSGSAAARRALLEHALARAPRAGDTLSRLRELGAVDLSGDRETVARLLAALQELTPRRVLGIRMGGEVDALTHLARALAGTTSPDVRRALGELAERFPEIDLATPRPASEEAAGAVRAVPTTIPASGFEDGEPFVPEISSKPAMSGDLEVFGLPGLLQSLQQSETTGRLLLRDTRGQTIAELRLSKGRLADCRAGRLSGEAAFFQLFESPSAATFELTRAEATETGRAGSSQELVALLMEAMRRYDELQRARAVVPDDVLLQAGEARPTAPPDESDGDLLRQVWTRVRGGARPQDCEVAVPVDAYRVRTLLAHWLETGAVIAVPAG